jgi:transcriptional regulator NrdR family protein
MNCPSCQHPKSRVINSRQTARRRECSACRIRWSTVEVIDSQTIAPARKIAKKDSRSWLEKIREKLESDT